MYKFIYAHVLYTQVNLLKRSQERERKERGERKRKKNCHLPKNSLHHRKFETGRSASFDHLKKVINLLFSLSERIFSFQIRLNISFFQSRHTHTHTRVYSRKNHPHRAHLNSHAQRQHLCSLRTRKTHHKVKKMSFSTTFTGAKIAQKSILQKQSVDKQISARRTKASSPSMQKKAQIASFGSLAPPDLYPEFGTYPGGGNSLIIPYTDEKNAERELIHGRWAQLGVTGAWAAENGTGIPWFTAGTLCTPDDCTAVADKFPGAVAPLAPEGSGYPNFWAVLAIEVFLVGNAEAYRTGIFENPFPELELSVSPGGRFDPLGFAEAGDLEELKIKELKHCRLSMFAWLGCIMQALATQEGPIANWTAHTADPVHANVLTNAAKGFGFY